MNQIQKDILTIAHQQYEFGENTALHFDYDEFEECEEYKNYEECLTKYTFNQLTNSYEFLVENGYIKEIFCGTNFAIFSLTAYGLEYCKNGFKTTSNISVTQGNNSILVNGSNNTISDNYSTIYRNIQQSDICDEHKQLLCQLIQELSTKPKHQVFDEVKSCISKIVEVGSNAAITHSVSLLIAEIFAHIA